MIGRNADAAVKITLERIQDQRILAWRKNGVDNRVPERYILTNQLNCMVNHQHNESIRGMRNRSQMTTAENNRGRILSAARAEFIEKGLSGARMQSIADRAGVNKALLHYYFDSKNKLYQLAIQDVFEQVWKTINDRLSASHAHNDLRSIIRAIVETYITSLAAEQDVVRVIVREIADGGTTMPRIAETLVRALGPFPRQLIAALEQEEAHGVIRPIKPEHLMLNIIGMCIITFISRPFFDGVKQLTPIRPTFDEQFFKERIEEIVNTACYGIFSPEPKR